MNVIYTTVGPDIDDLNRHEALDRTHLLQEILASHLLDHPYVEKYPKLGATLQRAMDELGRAYQMIGCDDLPE